MFNSLPRKSGIYNVKDNINNLQFQISFRSINTVLKLPKYNVQEHTQEQERTSENSQTDDSIRRVLIKWQEKLFSPTECKLYSDFNNCINDQQRKYHELLNEKVRNKKQTKKKRHRRYAKTESEEPNVKSCFIFTYVHADNFVPANEVKDNVTGYMKHHIAEPFEEMFVYAALQPDTQLAVIRWFKQDRLLYVYPDFTDSQSKPYFIEIDSDYRHLYSYDIKDASPKALPSLNDHQPFLYLPELPTHWCMEDEIGKIFAMPPKRTQRCAILLRINHVSGFEYNNVHVRYHIQLPKNIILEEGLIDATSHTSENCGKSSIQIGLSWQITVLCEEQFDPSQHLRIFFEVISIDSWERERIEGYSHYSFNLLKPCDNTVRLSCICPVETVLESINRYFIGGRRKFDYERFVCEESVDEITSSFHCRYRGRMRNSGQLSLSCQMLTQRNCELLNPCTSRTSGMTIDDIMMAYKEARRRLETVT